MDSLNKKNPSIDSAKEHITEAASDLLKGGKKLANDLYEEGINRANEVQKDAVEYTDEILQKVREKPLASVLVAAGVGFLLSALLRK